MTTRELREGCGPFVALSESINILKIIDCNFVDFFWSKISNSMRLFPL